MISPSETLGYPEDFARNWRERFATIWNDLTLLNLSLPPADQWRMINKTVAYIHINLDVEAQYAHPTSYDFNSIVRVTLSPDSCIVGIRTDDNAWVEKLRIQPFSLLENHLRTGVQECSTLLSNPDCESIIYQYGWIHQLIGYYLLQHSTAPYTSLQSG